jgi:hypothetical protein
VLHDQTVEYALGDLALVLGELADCLELQA